MKELDAKIRQTFESTLGHGHYSDRCFSEGTGLHLREASAIFHLLASKSMVMEADFLVAMNFMKEYRHEHIAGLPFNILSTATYEQRLWSTLALIDQSLLSVTSFLCGVTIVPMFNESI
jgi:hypothetical protein